jgi:hypothetical protein
MILKWQRKIGIIKFNIYSYFYNYNKSFAYCYLYYYLRSNINLRDDSMIKDILGTQIRSQLTCPDCSKVVVKYEYHQTMQLGCILKYIFNKFT